MVEWTNYSRVIRMPVSLLLAIAIALSVGASLLITPASYALEGSWYVGAGAGISRLTPDTEGSGFTLDDSESGVAGVYLGLDINRWLSAEVAFTDLGSAQLSNGESIDYSALSLGGVAYIFGESDVSRRQNGASGYVRLGFNQIDNDARIVLDSADNNALWIGAGVQWPLGRQWGIRGELTSFDGDAQALMASLYWRKAPSSSSRSSSGNPDASTADSNRSASTSGVSILESDKIEPAPAPLSAPDSALTSCTAPSNGEPTDSQGCALFSGVLQGVEFENDTSRILMSSQNVLNALASALENHPEIVIEIRAHTQAYAQVDRAMQLSRERAIAVARYLVGQGIVVRQLRARAFGSTQPLRNDSSEAGRRQNNRVELRVL